MKPEHFDFAFEMPDSASTVLAVAVAFVEATITQCSAASYQLVAIVYEMAAPVEK